MLDKESKDYWISLAAESQEYTKDPALRIVVEGYQKMRDYEQQAKNKGYDTQYTQQIRQKMSGLIQNEYQRKVQDLAGKYRQEREQLIDKYYEKKAKSADAENLRERDLKRKYQAMPVEDRDKLAGAWKRGEKKLSPVEIRTLAENVSQEMRELMQPELNTNKELTEPYMAEADIATVDQKTRYYEDIKPGTFKYQISEKDGDTMEWPLGEFFG